MVEPNSSPPLGARSFSKLNRLIPNASFAERRNRPFASAGLDQPPLEKTTLHDAAQAPLAAASIPGVPLFLLQRNQILVDVDVDRADLTSLPTIIEAH